MTEKITNEKTGIDPDNAKAVYRLALGLSKTMEYEKAIELLKKHLSKNSEKMEKWQQDEMKQLLATVSEQQKKYLKKESQIYKNLFN